MAWSSFKGAPTMTEPAFPRFTIGFYPDAPRPSTPVSMSSLIINEAVATFRAQKQMAERAFGQLTDEQLRTPLNADTNSVAVIIKHMAGNMLSRWTDFLTS